MSKEPLEYINHIADECRYLLSVSVGLSKEDLINNETLKQAVVRSLEIIGEATKKIPADFKEQYNTMPWKNMAGLRDRLVHDYLGVNYSIIWDIVTNKIPELNEQVQEILQDRSSSA